MRVVIAGGGKVGMFVAEDLAAAGHQIVVIEQNPALQGRGQSILTARWIVGDACELTTLHHAGLQDVDVAIAATGDDEDNLVFSLLAKQEFGVPEVIARVNSPRNERLFTAAWGVDVAVSLPHMVTAAVGEAVSVGRLVRLLSLERGGVRLVEVTLAEDSPAVGARVMEIDLPRDASLVAIIRDQHVIVPGGDSQLEAGDELLALVTPAAEELFRSALESAVERQP